jgi:hypothetical protein
VQNSPVPRFVQALGAGFSHTSHLSFLVHSRRRIALTPLMKTRLENLAVLLKFPTDQIFLPEPERENHRHTAPGRAAGSGNFAPSCTAGRRCRSHLSTVSVGPDNVALHL